jgi:hypothetical protein
MEILDFGHSFTFGASSDDFFFMNAEKSAILACPISTFSTSKVAKRACHNHNTQHNTQQPK